MGKLDVSQSVHDLFEFDDSLHPCGGVAHGFSESSVEDGLEGKDKGNGDSDISDGKSVSNEVVLASEGGVQDLDGILDSFNGVGVLTLLWGGVSEDSHIDGVDS